MDGQRKSMVGKGLIFGANEAHLAFEFLFIALTDVMKKSV